MKTPVLIYVAHPYGGDSNNLRRAKEQMKLLNCFHYPEAPALFWAPWIDVCLTRPDNGGDLNTGLNFDLHAVGMSHGFLVLGERQDHIDGSSGIRVEARHAKQLFIPSLVVPRDVGRSFHEVVKLIGESHEFRSRWDEEQDSDFTGYVDQG